MFLTFPFIEQAIALKFRLLSVQVVSGPSVRNRKMSVIAIFRRHSGNDALLLMSRRHLKCLFRVHYEYPIQFTQIGDVRLVRGEG
jgi:hypothetical protein